MMDRGLNRILVHTIKAVIETVDSFAAKYQQMAQIQQDQIHHASILTCNHVIS